jgi:hypothetical protein
VLAGVKIIERSGGELLKVFKDHNGAEGNHYRIAF